MALTIQNFPTPLFIQFHRDCQKHNSMYVPLEHPRWGAIMGVMTTTRVNYLDEIIVSYKLQNEEIGGDKEDDPYLAKTEL